MIVSPASMVPSMTPEEYQVYLDSVPLNTNLGYVWKLKNSHEFSRKLLSRSVLSAACWKRYIK